MQARHRTLVWPSVFFGCGALSALIGYVRLVWAHAVPALALGRGLFVSGVMFAAYVTITVQIVRELRYAAAPRIQARVLLAAGIGLFLVSAAVSLR
jgi:hypothetical protein